MITNDTEITFLERELNRVKSALEAVEPESKDYSRLIKMYLPIEKRYAARIAEQNKLKQAGLQF